MEQIFVKDFVHETEIGVYQSEFGKKQRLKFNVFLTIDYLNKNKNDNIKDVISKITMESNVVSNEFEIFFINKKIDHLLYTEEVSESASIVSKIPEVRECMMKIQKQCVKGEGLIANGRDMGTEVFPEADLKLYVNANLDVRAKRRYDELKSKGEDVNLEDIHESLKKRDESDTNRLISPLRVPDNAKIIDTSDLKPDAIVDKILNLYTITKN